MVHPLSTHMYLHIYLCTPGEYTNKRSVFHGLQYPSHRSVVAICAPSDRGPTPTAPLISPSSAMARGQTPGSPQASAGGGPPPILDASVPTGSCGCLPHLIWKPLQGNLAEFIIMRMPQKTVSQSYTKPELENIHLLCPCLDPIYGCFRVNFTDVAHNLGYQGSHDMP